MNRLYAGTGKIIATKKSHREPHVFARKGQNGVSPGPRHPGTDSGFEAASLSWSSACSPKAVQRASVGSFCKSARGSRKPSSNGCSSSLINQGLDSSMYARGHMSVLAGSTKKRTNAVPRPALAARRAMLGNAGREAGKCTACWLSAERAGLVVEARIGSSAGLQRNGQRAGPTSLTSRLVRTRIRRPESRGAKLRGAASSARSPRLPSMCHVRGDQQEAPAVALL